MEDVAEQEARAEKHDAGLQPEFVRGDAGLKDARDADRVCDEKAEDDSPEDILDVGEGKVVRLGVGGDGLLNEFSGVAHGDEQEQSRDERENAAAETS